MKPLREPSLIEWGTWYKSRQPELFDLDSFAEFLKQNEVTFYRCGLLLPLRGSMYLVTPEFDLYINNQVRHGFLRSLLCQKGSANSSKHYHLSGGA